MLQKESNVTPAKAGNWILPTYGNTDCWKDYEPGTIMGKGTFGTTYLATKKGTNLKYAVKVGGRLHDTSHHERSAPHASTHAQHGCLLAAAPGAHFM